MNSHLGGEPRSAIIHKSAKFDKGQSLSGKQSINGSIVYLASKLDVGCTLAD